MDKLYKDTQGNIYAVSPIQTPKKEWAALTKKETEAYLNPQPTDPDAEWNGSTWEVPFAILVERKKAEIAQARYNAEIAGVTINGVSIKTDRESQGLITGAALKAMQDSTYTCRWKGIDGFVELTAPQIIAVADAVRQHVQSCFDREAELQPLIEAATTEAELNVVKWGD